MDDKRKVYFVQQTVTDKDGNYIPCIAVEGEKGYYKTDWEWGKDYKLACQWADEKNEAMGISKKDSIIIQLQSMRH